ncbi:MAG: thiol peroxidase [Desulfobacterium sp.]|jgi:thiol peroxidase|nr:thiol peroxidase [Desulfobacterium sp.]
MANFTIGGNPAKTSGKLPRVGEKAPDFLLTRTDLTDISLKDVAGKRVVLNIFPSVDTSVCSTSVRRFNKEIKNYADALVLCVSLDLPFTHKRFCETEGIKDVIPVSELRNREFGRDYGLRIVDGPFAGLLARAVVVIDQQGTVVFSMLVPELETEPDYGRVLAVLAKTTIPQEVCTQTSTAEHSRPNEEDEPCDDGRAG